MSFQLFKVSCNNNHFQVGPISENTKEAQEINLNPLSANPTKWTNILKHRRIV